MRFRPLILAFALVAALVTVVPTNSGPAQAAAADRWGFALVDNPTVPTWTVLNTTRQWGSWKPGFPGLWALGGKIAAGRFQVRFPQVGTSVPGIVHVTPVNRTGHYCEVVNSGPAGTDQLVVVQCHAPGGTPSDTAFTILWTLSSGIVPVSQGTHAYVRSTAAGGIVQAYNSTGGGVGVLPGPPGQYQVTLAGVGGTAGPAGNLQVTAISTAGAPRRCKFANWGPSGLDIVAIVTCFNQAGVLTATEFNLSYHRERSVIGSFAPPKFFGYFSPFGGQTNFNYPIGFGVNTLSGGPVWQLVYPQLAVTETHAQVVAQGTGPEYCHLTWPWTYVGLDANVSIICFNNAGTVVPYRFLSTFTSKD
ncbi:hypothetical protein [Polymorphospora rubra]|uniref:Uncharacterized protein n=1 Tax=Polymorphospora rubra TaxID=338584 RepID=A0A810N5Y0_9ACTN|nr:hypothetical protein [Polymorphospora rubra]BCJ66865.1 hypothetical protein Prubr_38860 [Polymorphospora rubra]